MEKSHAITVEKKPWDRMDEESPYDYASFRVFLDMQPSERNLVKASEVLNQSYSAVTKKSMKYDWFRRAMEWDHRKQQVSDEVILSEVQKRTKEQLDTLKASRILGTLSITTHLDIEKQSKINKEPSSISARDAMNLVKESVLLERLITGNATERTEHMHGEEKASIDLSRLTPEEAEKLLELMTKAGVWDD